MVVSWILFSLCSVLDVVVEKQDSMAHDGIMPFALEGWEVGSVFPSLSSVFGFFGRSGFLVVCMRTPLLTVAFAVFYFEKIGWFIPLKEKRKVNIQYLTLGSPEGAYTWLLKCA